MTAETGDWSVPSDVVSKWGQTGPAAHFYHANGYPPAVYAPLLSRLGERLALSSLPMRPVWPSAGPPPRNWQWLDYARDLVRWLEAREGEPIVGIGHSMGATATAMAAVLAPERFTELVLIEPAAIPVGSARLLALIPMALRRRFLQPGKSTLTRTDHWPSRAAFAEKIATWRSLSKLDDAALRAFADGAVRETDDGRVTLAFPRAWEAHNFFMPSTIAPWLDQLECPVTVLRGDPSIFFSDAMWARWARKHPHHRIIRIDDAGHLLPMEKPGVCAAHIIDTVLAS